MKQLTTERLILRALTAEDAEVVEQLAIDKEIARTTLTIPYPYPKGSAKGFISSMLEAEKEGKLAIFGVVIKDSNQLIGIINLSNIKAHKRGELAYWIGRPFWGNGYGTEAAKELLRFGFEEFSLNKIFAASFTNNPGSWRIMEKIGMKHEGTFRQHVMKWNEPMDLAYYSILKEEYVS